MNSNWTLMNYRELKKQIKNAVSELGTVLELKGVVTDTSKLPLTGNKKGDVYIVSENNTEYLWTSDNASGLITDYEELGPVISGSFLPPVTETDAGKVATVNNSGVWVASGLGDSDRVFEIYATYSDGTYTVSETYDRDEFLSARANLYSFRCLIQESPDTTRLTFLTRIAEISESGIIVMSGYGVEGELLRYTFYITSDGVQVSVEKANTDFIVTLTPTSADYSGTMDKTVAEIDAAYKAGREIVFRVYAAAGTYNEADCTVKYKNNNLAYPSFNAYIVDNINNVLIFAYTGANNDGTAQTYSTAVYPLTHEPFIVTLTPTDEDFSGTMDKTVAEINEAYLSGRRIVFSISALGMNVEFPLVDANKSDDYDYPSFDAVLWNVIDNVFMHVSTSFTDSGDKDTYAVYTFPMTYDSANGVSF